MRLCEMKGWFFRLNILPHDFNVHCDVCRRKTKIHAIVSPTQNWVHPPKSARCVCKQCFEDWVRRNYEHAVAQELMA